MEYSELDSFTRGYIQAVFFCGVYDNDGETGEIHHAERDFNFDDLVESALNTIIEDCKDFQESNQADLEGENLEQCGTDFYFTRNGHGAGFWDGDYEREKGERLTANSKPYGEQTFYVGDDSKIYLS
jgi:hypothetical protein